MEINYTLIRSNRKTCGIIVRGQTVTVRAPRRMKQADIDRAVQSKRDWINKKLKQFAGIVLEQNAFLLHYGDTVQYRGGQVLIAAEIGCRFGLHGEKIILPDGLTPEQIKSACVRFYQQQAKTVLTQKVTVFADCMGACPAAVKISNAKGRWGSCSNKKSINFSWRLMMADDAVIDYIVVHELAHLKEMNHSPRFWAIVEQTMPDYKNRQKELRKLQINLQTQNWE